MSLGLVVVRCAGGRGIGYRTGFGAVDVGCEVGIFCAGRRVVLSSAVILAAGGLGTELPRGRRTRVIAWLLAMRRRPGLDTRRPAAASGLGPALTWTTAGGEPHFRPVS